MEISWKFICIQLAEKFHSDGLGGKYNQIFLRRCWASLFDTSWPQYPSNQSMSLDFAIFYGMFATICDNKSYSDKQKVNNCYFLLETIVGRFDYDKVGKIFAKGGYNDELPLDDNSPILSHHGKFHEAVLTHSGKLFQQGHYSIAVNEACKAYIKAVANKSQLQLDGRELMMKAFGDKATLLITPNITETDKTIQEGMKFISAGTVQAFRNPTSHETAKDFTITKDDCVDILRLVSYLFKQLDKSKSNP